MEQEISLRQGYDMARKIYIASDHAGFELKNKLIDYLEELGYTIQDMGAFVYDAQDDYPDFISLAAREVSKSPMDSLGVLIGGSGQGEAMVANRFPNVRAALICALRPPVSSPDISGRQSSDPYESVRLAREHNDSNILSIGARFLTLEEAKQALKIWLETPFSGEERHVRRIDKMEELLVE